MVKNVTPSLQRFAMGSHRWGPGANLNFVKAAMMLQTGVLSRVDALPENPQPNDRYLLNTNNRLHMWMEAFDDDTAPEPAQWVSMAPGVGMLVFVENEEKFYAYREEGVWQVVIDLNATHQAVQRELAFYVPGRIRPSAPVFTYIAGMELTIPAGAPGSAALLEVAPTAPLTFTIRHNSTSVGTIFFDAGQTEAEISFPAERIIYDAWVENALVTAHMLRIMAPADLFGAQGLSVTLRGKIRAMD